MSETLTDAEVAELRESYIASCVAANSYLPAKMFELNVVYQDGGWWIHGIKISTNMLRYHRDVNLNFAAQCRKETEMNAELEEHHRERVTELLRQTQRHPDEEPSQATMLEAYKLVLLKDLVHFLDQIETAILNR